VTVQPRQGNKRHSVDVRPLRVAIEGSEPRFPVKQIQAVEVVVGDYAFLLPFDPGSNQSHQIADRRRIDGNA
jgi:hypothetical protein